MNNVEDKVAEVKNEEKDEYVCAEFVNGGGDWRQRGRRHPNQLNEGYRVDPQNLIPQLQVERFFWPDPMSLSCLSESWSS